MRRRRNRRTVGTLDSEEPERGPEPGVAGGGLSGAAGRLAAPLGGGQSRRGDGSPTPASWCVCVCALAGSAAPAVLARAALLLGAGPDRMRCFTCSALLPVRPRARPVHGQSAGPDGPGMAAHPEYPSVAAAGASTARSPAGAFACTRAAAPSKTIVRRQIIVQGALRSKARDSLLVKARCVAGERDKGKTRR